MRCSESETCQRNVGGARLQLTDGKYAHSDHEYALTKEEIITAAYVLLYLCQKREVLVRTTVIALVNNSSGYVRSSAVLLLYTDYKMWLVVFSSQQATIDHGCITRCALRTM